MTIAGRWILAIGVLLAVGGTVAGFGARREAEAAHRNLNRFAANETVVTDDGESFVVAELREQVDQEVLLVFGVNYLLAGIMIGLYFWSRRAPLPAIVTALAVYLAVQVLGGIMDPATIFRGIIIKVFAIGGLLAGVKAALAQTEAGVDGGGPAAG